LVSTGNNSAEKELNEKRNRNRKKNFTFNSSFLTDFDSQSIIEKILTRKRKP
jgi:hypothetical protein